MPFAFLSLALTLYVAHWLLTRLLATALLLMVLSTTGCVRCDIMRCDTEHTMELRPSDYDVQREMRTL